jgi:hypothetical protein
MKLNFHQDEIPGFWSATTWLEATDVLVLERDDEQSLVVMPLSTVIDLIFAASGKPVSHRGGAPWA